MSKENHRYKLLFLEDEPIIGRILSRTFEGEGFEMDIAANGLIAKEKIDSNNNYDLLVLDIRTPVISGSQLYEYLKREHSELINKVIFATGDTLSETTREFLERVKRPFLTKPYTTAQIKNLVVQTIEQNLTLADKLGSAAA